MRYGGIGDEMPDRFPLFLFLFKSCSQYMANGGSEAESSFQHFFFSLFGGGKGRELLCLMI